MGPRGPQVGCSLATLPSTWILPLPHLAIRNEQINEWRSCLFKAPEGRFSQVRKSLRAPECLESQGYRAESSVNSLWAPELPRHARVLTSTPNSHDLCSAISWHLVTGVGGRAGCPLRACVSPTRPGVAGLNPGGCGWEGRRFPASCPPR